MPEVISSVAGLRIRLSAQRDIGLVPTMGALHKGHESLLETARRENRCVVASIFVNPIQFDRKEDLESYPRAMDEDLRVCDARGVDLVFAPSAADLYPREQATFVESPALSRYLCGASRQGHFRGVATVVLKLFNIVQPQRAYFGEKDAQQLAIIRRMVDDLNVPVAVVAVPTVREADGLALSSRNRLLTPEQRKVAPVLAQALHTSLDLIDKGERSATAIRRLAMAMVERHPEVRLEYFEVADPVTLAPVDHIAGPVLMAAAMWLGSTRLIDNVAWSGAEQLTYKKQ